VAGLIHEPVVTEQNDPPNGRRAPWARDEHERCEVKISEHLRCMLVKHHDGLHAWRSPLGERTFEWG